MLENELTMDFCGSRDEPKSMTSSSNRRCESRKIHWLMKTKRFGKIPFCFLALGFWRSWRTICSVRSRQCLGLTKMFLKALTEEAMRTSKSLARQWSKLLLLVALLLCPGTTIRPSNPKWVTPMSQWKELFQRKWIIQTNRGGDPIARQFSLIFGGAATWGWRNAQSSHHEEIQKTKEKIFLNFLAKNATDESPPSRFFSKAVVRKVRKHKNEFDIKSRAMMPLAWLGL